MSFFDDLVNFGKGVVSAPVKFANTAATQVGEINATKDGLIAQLTGDKAGLRRATAMQNYYRKQHDNGGLFGMGSMYSSADAARGDLGTGIQKIGGGTAQTVASVAPFAKGGSIALGAGKQALLSSIPKVAGQGAAYGGLYSAGQQFADTGQINPVQLAQDTAMGAVGNVAIPLALRGGKVGLQQWAKASNAVADHGANITMPANRVAEGGFLGGKNAAGFNDAQKAGKVFDGVDGQPRFEVSDKGAKLNSRYVDDTYINGSAFDAQRMKFNTTAADVLDHPELFRQYPELAKVNMGTIDTGTGTFGQHKGEYNPETNTIYVNKDLSSEDAKGTILHELQHAIQSKENFAAGGNAGNGVDNYRNLAGEAEARAVQARMNMGDGERYRSTQHYNFETSTPSGMTSSGNGKTTFSTIAENQRKARIRAEKWSNRNGLTLDPESIRLSNTPETSIKNSTFYDSLDVPKKDLIVKRDGGTAMSIDPNESLPHDLNYMQEQVASHGSAKEFRDKMVNDLWSMNKKGAGTDSSLVHSDPGSYDVTGRVTVSNNNPFYQEFYREHGYKPTKKAIEDMVDQQLGVKSSKDSIYTNILDKTQSGSPVDADIYAQLKDRETSLNRQIASEKSITPPPPASLPTTAPVPTSGEKLSRFANKTAQNTDELSPELKKMVKEQKTSYDPVTNKGRLDTAEATLGKKSDDQAYLHVAKSFEIPGKATDQDVVNAIQTIKRLDATGDETNLFKATELFDTVSRHLSKRGQEIQAASLLYNRTPQGLVYKAARDLKKAGVNVTPEMQNTIKKLSEDVANAPDNLAKQMAIAKLSKHVANLLPQNGIDNAVSLWKAGLLSGAKTQTGNALSNGTFGALKTVSNPLAAGIDKGLSMFTGQRTKTATLRGVGSGTEQGIGNGINTLKTGIDPRSLDKYEQFADIKINNPVLQKVLANPANFVFRTMSAGDQPFYYAALKNNLFDIAKADGLNKGLKGKALTDHMKASVEKPSTKQLEMATAAANKAVLGYDTIASKAVQGIHKGIDNADFAGQFGKSVAHAAVSTLAPFVRVPTAFLARTLDYSPVGAGRALIKAAREGKNFDQRALSEALAEATTGTGIIYLGAELTNNGLVSGQYPDDPKEQQRWKAEGITPNSVKVGGKWVSLNYLGPSGLLIGAGKDYVDAAGRGDNAALQSIAGFGKNLMGQSFLTGFSGFADAINDPERSLGTFINKQAGSIVPTISNDIGNFFDDKQRQTNNPLEAIQSRIPGLRNNLNAKQDVYGNELNQPTDKVTQLVNPLKPSNSLTDKSIAVAEVSRLHNVDKQNKDLQVTPTTVDKNFTVGDTQVKLNDQQRYDLQKKVGQSTQSRWDELIQTPEYQALNDPQKAQALNDLRLDSTAVTQREYVTNNNLAQYKKDLTKNQQKLANGTADIASYAKQDDTVATAQKKPAKVTKASRRTGSRRGGGGGKANTSQASLISATASGAKTAANAKLAVRSGGFQSKISGRSIEAYKKPTKTIVRKT